MLTGQVHEDVHGVIRVSALACAERVAKVARRQMKVQDLQNIVRMFEHKIAYKSTRRGDLAKQFKY